MPDKTAINHSPDYSERPENPRRASLSLAITLLGQFDGTPLLRVSELPPSPGYERLLRQHGVNFILARGIAYLARRRGERRENYDKRRAAVVRAFKFFTKSRRNRPARAQRAMTLLKASAEPSVLAQILKDSGVNVFDLVRLLESVAQGDETAYVRLEQYARALEPNLPRPRGRRISAPSAAHEFMLQNFSPLIGQTAYSWNEIKGECTDALTEATRREFGLKRFDPRPAYHRAKAKAC